MKSLKLSLTPLFCYSSQYILGKVNNCGWKPTPLSFVSHFPFLIQPSGSNSLSGTFLSLSLEWLDRGPPKKLQGLRRRSCPPMWSELFEMSLFSFYLGGTSRVTDTARHNFTKLLLAAALPPSWSQPGPPRCGTALAAPWVPPLEFRLKKRSHISPLLLHVCEKAHKEESCYNHPVVIVFLLADVSKGILMIQAGESHGGMVSVCLCTVACSFFF